MSVRQARIYTDQHIASKFMLFPEMIMSYVMVIDYLVKVDE